MGKGSAPDAPDPYATSAAQTQSNILTAQNQAKLNAVDQSNPYGSTTFQRDANGDPISQTSALTPEMQALLGGKVGQANTMTGVSNQLMGNLNTGAINAPTVNDTGNQAYQSMAGWLRPEFEQQNKEQGIQLDQRGLPIGSEARTAATDATQRNQNQALTQAAAQAQVQGATEQNTLFGQAVQQNQIPYQNLTALMSANPSNSLLASAPGAISTSPTTIQPTNVSGNVYQTYNDQLAKYNQQSQNSMGTAQGIGSMALLAMMMMSDENSKENRKPADGESILLKFRDLPVDHYDYKEETKAKYNVPESRTGPMAQDYARAFAPNSEGKTIDLGDMMGNMLAAIKALEERTHGSN